jgi:hypothetical protein
MLRNYKDYKYVKTLRRNVYLVRDINGASYVLSIQSIKNKDFIKVE